MRRLKTCRILDARWPLHIRCVNARVGVATRALFKREATLLKVPLNEGYFLQTVRCLVAFVTLLIKSLHVQRDPRLCARVGDGTERCYKKI